MYIYDVYLHPCINAMIHQSITLGIRILTHTPHRDPAASQQRSSAAKHLHFMLRYATGNTRSNIKLGFPTSTTYYAFRQTRTDSYATYIESYICKYTHI